MSDNRAALLDHALGQANAYLSENLPGSDVRLVLVCEVDDGGVYIGFDYERVSPGALVTTLRRAADRIEAVRG